MSFPRPLAIRGTGRGIPSRVFTNNDFEKILDTSDDWIVTRTGIKERRYTAENESTLTMALDASRRALDDAKLMPSDIDMIIVGTISPERTLPSTACFLQTELGCRHIPAFDISAACSGFMYALNIASQFIHSKTCKHVLIVGVENLSRIMDFQDRTSCVIFGDGASAAIISHTDSPQQSLLYAGMGADGEGAKLIWIPAGGSAEPVSQRTVDERLHFIRMKGREVYKFAVQKMHDTIDEILGSTGIRADELSLVIPHQSNLRIIESAREKLGLPMEKIMVNIDRYGNTSSASVGICLDEARKSGRLKAGDLVMMVAFGAGLTWGSALLRL